MGVPVLALFRENKILLLFKFKSLKIYASNLHNFNGLLGTACAQEEP